MTETDPFDAPVRAQPNGDAAAKLVIRLDGYEGPLDVLLDLARRQKVDLRSISILALVDQYLAFIEEAKARAYATIESIDWPEGFYRKDIGWRAVGR